MKLELLRLLSAQASQYEVSDHVWDTLQPADIAHALGFADEGGEIRHRPAALLGRVMFAGEKGFISALAIALADRTRKRLNLQRNYARLVSVCCWAIYYFIDPKLCAACHGAGSIQLGGAIGTVQCRLCEGSGIAKPLSQHQLAESCEIPWSSWQEHWSEVYEEAEYGLYHYLDIVIGALIKRLSDQNSLEPGQSLPTNGKIYPKNQGY